MCELFGLSSRKPQMINEELREFYSHSPEHPHGWGLALLDHDRFTIEKEPMRAIDSLYLKERLSEPIITKTALAHIRFGTIGNIERRNCHPFTGIDASGRKWTLIHNGTIFESEVMQKYVSQQNGDTDSERVFLFLMDLINQKIKVKGRSLCSRERFEVVDSMVTQAAPHNKLNLLIYDGDMIYAHSNFKESLHQRVTEDSVYFSTQPLANGDWEPVPFTQLVAYEDEKLVFTGTVHGHEYIFDQKKLDLVLLAFAQL